MLTFFCLLACLFAFWFVWLVGLGFLFVHLFVCFGLTFFILVGFFYVWLFFFSFCVCACVLL